MKNLYYIFENICFLNYVFQRPLSLNLSDNGSHCKMSTQVITLIHHFALHSETDENEQVTREGMGYSHQKQM